MSRAFQIVLFLVAMVVACKCDKPAAKKPEQASRAEPGAPRGPAGRTETAAAPATPGDPSKPADPANPDQPTRPGESQSDDPSAGTNTPLQDKGLAMMQRMSDLFTTHASDCTKLAAEIRSLVAGNKELLDQLRAEDLKQTGAQRTAFEARNRAVTEAAFAKMSPVTKACRENPAFMAAMRDAQSQ
jgi:hypothetical protein